jgi:hypothetical protein
LQPKHGSFDDSQYDDIQYDDSHVTNLTPGSESNPISGLQRSTSALRLMSPLSKMKRTNTANAPLKVGGCTSQIQQLTHSFQAPGFNP